MIQPPQENHMPSIEVQKLQADTKERLAQVEQKTKRDKQQTQEQLENHELKIALVEAGNKELKITSLNPTFLHQFNGKIRDTFPPNPRQNIFEITSVSGKDMTIKLLDPSKSQSLKKFQEYLRLFFSDTIIDNATRQGNELKIKARFSDTAIDLEKFFKDSNLPIQM